MSSSDFPLLPADAQTTSDEDLAAAVQGRLAASQPQPVAPDTPAPFGRSFLFDFELGEFVGVGGSPARTSGLDTLKQWCLMAIHSTRYAHQVFSDEFGMEDPDEPFGELVSGEIAADWQQHLIEALMVHDRITSVENVSITWDPSEGVLSLDSMDVVTDEDQTMVISGVQLQIGGGQ